MPNRRSELSDELRQQLRQLTQSGKLPTRYAKIVADQLNQLPRKKPITPNQVSQVGVGRSGTLEIAQAIIALAEDNYNQQLVNRINRLLNLMEATENSAEEDEQKD